MKAEADIDSLTPNIRKATRLLKLMASEHRLSILCRLFDGEASVSDLADYVGQSVSTTSQHLAKMRAEELVETRRDGQTIYYSIADQGARRVVDVLCELYGG
ncbi:transcriptional activator hlyU [Asticcacaulis biprosthecium C19]|uniref:Transcriptional activator hlyU n=1 Tax=Asticcacaulis biprosthecium C19 TaxID=715226 RepID=F4QTE9_9CAUL|nr:metalloregulator ArsR/SmtB family transcription factor [Asticcacaulis biprosthecium]EGF90019.1 transcriptional activator hlyU [Asticcacaulis biprosthecium C19]